MANGGETFDQMIARVQSRRESSMPKGDPAGYLPSVKASRGGDDSSSKPSFIKKKKGKPFGKAAPAQKSMMRSGRSFGRGR